MGATAFKLSEVSESEPGLRIAGVHPIESELDRVRQQLDAMQRELEELRQRDLELRFSLTRMDEELKLAARVQQDFLPRALPQVAGVKFTSLYRPAGFVSGDLYDVMRLD